MYFNTNLVSTLPLKIAGRIAFFMISSGYPAAVARSCNTTHVLQTKTYRREIH